jgi:nucleoside-diphosphate-sugar epimerase
MMDKVTLLLTGGTGFLGSHLLKALSAYTDFKIICLKRSFSDIKRISKINNSNIVYYNIDQVTIDKVFEENKIDIVVHVATDYGRNHDSIYQVLETNLLFPIKIIELAIQKGVKCFINTDSYFNKENFSYNYLLNYSLSKKSFLSWLNKLSSKIQIVNMVLEHLYGEYDNSTKFIENLIQKVAIQKVDKMDLTYGHQRRDFIYISDVVDAYLAIINYSLKHSFQYEVFEIGSGISNEIRYFSEMVKRISGSETLLNYGVIPYRSDEIMESKADTKKISDLDWSPKVNIEEGIRRIISVYQEEDHAKC